ncbi:MULTISPECIES: hypothetical protein [unclassified Chryseobacterium]|uniref:hypothetical protein n=1 Tax=unclassified Chryseobacterium TaxID=2593645 RepID=UPI00100A3636|nr:MULTISPECIES: hypothetical protein [unclassified Chryseobacterium]RXM53793.1 hypothetical protein BOQ64_00290 [Chryseobacterium sp. CH25]RXM66007.1 hypothetical protein BOQ60_09225 [Chryseobacterium sp. CH1]
MKNIILLTGFLFSGFVSAQVGIGKEMVDGDGILDFALNTTNGIMLPIVETLPNDAVAGTILMDKNDKIVKMKDSSAWVELSDAGSINNATFNTSTEVPGPNRVIIGNSTTNAPGVLVLESTDKALILPKIADPHINVKSPYPGMICYDTVSKTMAVFDGLKWSYWK